MFKVFVTTVPFAQFDDKPLRLLESAGISVVQNPTGRKLQDDELEDLVEGFDAIIAGTEIISQKVFARSKTLKLISRVGIGLDGVDLLAAQKHGVSVSYTPDAPSNAVVDLTIGLTYSLLRKIHIANNELHSGKWVRHFGRRIDDLTVGIIGLGRIGSSVVEKFRALGVQLILGNDLSSDIDIKTPGFKWTSLESIFRECDVISLHVPLTSHTYNMIKKKQLLSMKKDVVLVNTSRGGIVNEQDLYDVMLSGHISGAAMDVFENEPYRGNLTSIPNCLLTAHMGSMTYDSRGLMELEASEEVVRFAKGLDLKNSVPENEYELRRMGL
ncbi:phosphoglycerate dehydrogenase [Alphaproteobacteria bacterium]|nr:phosphoglycerate dehydrogenase [Alphaproteobacteria bacterium]